MPLWKRKVFESRYEVLIKLDFGSVSTAWLCRDLRAHEYVTIKVYQTGHRQASNEYKVLQHLASLQSEHPGSKLVRVALDSFELQGKGGAHVCIVHSPLGLPLEELRQFFEGEKLPAYPWLKGIAYRILVALDFLHSDAGVVHTDIQAGNIMFNLLAYTDLEKAVEEEWTNPSLRKVDGDREVYFSATIDIPDDLGAPVIAYFGDAQFGRPPFLGEVMPDLYRVPEIILAIPWDEKIDIWEFGLMTWHMLERKSLFDKRLPSREASRPDHLAKMISLMGPPPLDLIKRGRDTTSFFSEEGVFLHQDLLSDVTLETEEDTLEGDEKVQFLAFIRRMLQWRPEDRASASELVKDPWFHEVLKEE